MRGCCCFCIADDQFTFSTTAMDWLTLPEFPEIVMVYVPAGVPEATGGPVVPPPPPQPAMASSTPASSTAEIQLCLFFRPPGTNTPHNPSSANTGVHSRKPNCPTAAVARAVVDIEILTGTELLALSCRLEGFTVQFAPAGAPLQLRDTAPVNPSTLLTFRL